MKKILLFVLTLLLVFTVGGDITAYAEQADDYKQDSAYLFVKEFTEKFPNRKAGVNVNSPKDNPLQKYLIEKLVDASHGQVTFDSVSLQEFDIDGYNRGYNIEARLNKSGSDKQIIIGAHYDSVGEGANDNACGVASLIKVMNDLSANASKLPCNVVFVLFDAEELGLFGSYIYTDRMSQADKDNTLIMINLDSIANGDNLYVWCENKRTDLADMILSKSDKLTEKPYAKGTYNIDNGLGYGYSEIPQNSDQTHFRKQGIPTALFFSGTYDADVWNYSESSDFKKNTMNTSADTFARLDEYNGAEFVAKINAVADAISLTVLDSRFLDTAESQRAQIVNLAVMGNAWWARLICGVIVVGTIVFALLYYRKLQKGAIMGTAEIKNNKVFSTPEAEDIFKFDDNKYDGNKPSVEDVFTFKDKKK